jgi:hypothetical protein
LLKGALRAMDGRLGQFKILILGLLALATSVTSRNAQAYPLYFDVQGGVGEYLNTTSLLFNSSTSGATSYGIGSSFGLFYTPIEPRDGLDIQIGIQGHYLGTNQDSRYYSTLAPYPAFRLQFWMVYATIGISPFVWRRSEGGQGFENFGLARNTLAYLGETGLLYAATPKFSMGVALNLQFFSSQGVLDSQPAVSGHFVMRFYFSFLGLGQDGPAAANPLEYSGWRYLYK